MRDVYIPATIKVHLGRPNENARDVEVPFVDYIKNVASSEIYPNWPQNALHANILAQISFALNRVYTEHYRNRGYDFDITNSPAVDQAYVHGREIFDSISALADDIFNNYVVRYGNVEPLFLQYCDGRTATCEGMSQWGSYELAKQGKTPYEILTYYYGDNLSIVRNAPIYGNVPSYPGTPIKEGDRGANVQSIQEQLLRIRKNYPLLPSPGAADGIFGPQTKQAVVEFQKTFNLEPDGIVGKSTWYKLNYVYVAVKKLAELDSEGEEMKNERPGYFDREVREGDVGRDVTLYQYFLQTVALYNSLVSSPAVSGTFDPATRQSVKSFQQYYGLPETGILNSATIRELYNVYIGILLRTLPPPAEVPDFPREIFKIGSVDPYVAQIRTYLLALSTKYPQIFMPFVSDTFDVETEAAVEAFQKLMGLDADGTVGRDTWNALTEEYKKVYAQAKEAGQNYNFDREYASFRKM